MGTAKNNHIPGWVAPVLLVFVFGLLAHHYAQTKWTQKIEPGTFAVITNNVTHVWGIPRGPTAFAWPVIETLKIEKRFHEFSLAIRPTLQGEKAFRVFNVVWEIEDPEKWVGSRAYTSEIQGKVLWWAETILTKEYESAPEDAGNSLRETMIITRAEKKISDLYFRQYVGVVVHIGLAPETLLGDPLDVKNHH